MPENDTRLPELKSQLRQIVEENDRILSAVNTDEQGDGSGNVVMSTEQVKTYRENLAKGNSLKEQISLVENQSALQEFLDSPGDVAAATKAAAAGYANQPLVRRTIGELFTESDEYKAFRRQGGYTMPQAWEVGGVDMGSCWTGFLKGALQDVERKDIFTWPGTGTGWGGTAGGAGVGTSTPFGLAPVQVDPMIPLPQRTVRVRDLFPVQPTTAAVIEFFRVTNFVNNASVVPQRDPQVANTYGMKPHSTLDFVATTAPIRTIAHWETAHRNALDDVQQLQGIINNELLYGLRLAEDAQILNGTGTGEDILGILN